MRKIIAFLKEFARTAKPLQPKISKNDIETFQKYNLLNKKIPFPILKIPTCKLIDHIAIPYTSTEHYHNYVFEEGVQFGAKRLALYFKNFQPKNFSEALRLGKCGAFSEEFEELPPTAVLNGLPWSTDERYNIQSKIVSTGCAHFGPNSKKFTQLEFTRLLHARLAMQAGYAPFRHSDGFIRGYLIEDGSDYCFLVTAGKHRAATIAGLEPEILVRLEWNNFLPVVSAQNVQSLPQVQSGRFSEESAIFLIDKYIRESNFQRC